jgi:menaquinone-dependent protoporphyrinogen IX oxidase
VARNREALRRVPVAYFCTAMSLTGTGETVWEGIPVAIDPKLAKPPSNPERLSFRERYATVESYLRPILRSGGALRPVSVAFFAGKLNLMRLSMVPQLFVLLVVQARPGDLRNWPFIQSWGAELGSAWLRPGEN